MGSVQDHHQNDPRPHVVCVPFPAQGHINPMLNLAKLLHHKGFFVTFVNTHYNHRRLLKSRGPAALDGLPDFRFVSIPDGLSPASGDDDATQDVPSLCFSTSTACLGPFRDLLAEINYGSGGGGVPAVTCVVSDGCMSFTLEAAEEIGVPNVLFWTTSACGFLAYAHYAQLVERGFTPLKDKSYLTNGYLDTVIDWIPGMKNIRLKDLPSFIQTTQPNDKMVNFMISQIERSKRATAIVLNTFDALEHGVLQNIPTIFPQILTLGPLHLFLNQIPQIPSKSIGSNLWKEEQNCLQWLDSKPPNSVLYVNFGSITVMTKHQLTEFAWGLANSKQPFLWIVRPDLIRGDTACSPPGFAEDTLERGDTACLPPRFAEDTLERGDTACLPPGFAEDTLERGDTACSPPGFAGDTACLPPGFVEETSERGVLAGWCAQGEVMAHPAVGGFLTHCGWNSTIESVSGGVPVAGWPFFAEQATNRWFCCNVWGVGMEIGGDVRREEVERQVRVLMEGERGGEMRDKAMEWKKMALEAVGPNGSSFLNLDKLVTKVLAPPKP